MDGRTMTWQSRDADGRETPSAANQWGLHPDREALAAAAYVSRGDIGVQRGLEMTGHTAGTTARSERPSSTGSWVELLTPEQSESSWTRWGHDLGCALDTGEGLGTEGDDLWIELDAPLVAQYESAQYESSLDHNAVALSLEAMADATDMSEPEDGAQGTRRPMAAAVAADTSNAVRGPPTAVADGGQGGPPIEVVPEGPEGPPVGVGPRSLRFDSRYFGQTLNVFRRSYQYQQHSAVLKWLRDDLERQGQTRLIFSDTEAIQVPTINHPPGPLYTFDESPAARWPWRWQEMIAHLTLQSREELLSGFPNIEPIGRGPVGAIVSCGVMSCPSYDHKRQCALAPRNPTAPLHSEWNFVVTLDDGTAIFLHPNWSNSKIAVKKGANVWDESDMAVPNTGKGGTSGRGTFKAHVEKKVATYLWFDTRSRADALAGWTPPDPQGKGNGKGAPPPPPNAMRLPARTPPAPPPPPPARRVPGAPA